MCLCTTNAILPVYACTYPQHIRLAGRFPLSPDMCTHQLARMCVKADVSNRELLAGVQLFSLGLNRHGIAGRGPKVRLNGAKGEAFSLKLSLCKTTANLLQKRFVCVILKIL